MKRAHEEEEETDAAADEQPTTRRPRLDEGEAAEKVPPAAWNRDFEAYPPFHGGGDAAHQTRELPSSAEAFAAKEALPLSSIAKTRTRCTTAALSVSPM